MTTSDPYHRFVGVYERLIEPTLTGVRRVAIEVLTPVEGWQVLDVGCGTGTGLVAYLDAGCRVAGIDVSAAMLDKAAARLPDDALLQLTDGTSLPFADNHFDLVTTTMVLHEVPADQRLALLAEMARVAKVDGRLQLIDFRFGSLRGWRGPTFKALSGVIERVSGHYSGYRSFRSTNGIPGLVARAGLRIIQEKIVAGGNVAIYVVTR